MAPKRLALITGATGGIGHATAVTIARTGEYNLALHYHSAGQEKRDKLAADIQDAAPPDSEVRANFFQADQGSFDSVRELHRNVSREMGNIDVLFNNAGASGGISGVQSLKDVPIEVFESSWRTNTGSAILLTQLCLPHMEEQNWGRIIFCSSVAALTGGVVGPHYASSKSAQHGLVYWLGNNVAKSGITVNAVAPALIGDTVMMGSSDDEQVKKRAAMIPAGRLGKPEEVAQTVMLLINCAYITRKVIAVDGGYHPY